MGSLDRAIWELLREHKVDWLQFKGRLRTIGAETLRVVLYDENGKILWAHGTTVPTIGTGGYAKGCIFIDTDVAAGSSGMYENIGDTTACNFSLGAATPGEITLAENNIIKGSALGVGEAAAIADERVVGRTGGGAVASIQIVNAHVANAAAIALSKLATQAATTILMNATAGAAVPTAVAIAASQFLAFDTATGTITIKTLAAGELIVSSSISGDLEQLALARSAILHFDGTDLGGLALVAGDIVTSDGADLLIRNLAAQQLFYFDSIAGTIQQLAVAPGDIVTADATDVAVVSIAAGEVVVGVAGPAVDGLAIAANELLSCDNAGALDSFTLPRKRVLTGGATQLTTVELDVGEILTANATDLTVRAIGAGEVLYFDGTGLAALYMPEQSLLINDSATGLLSYLELNAGELVTADATDVAVVAIAAGEVVVGATGPVIDGVALATGSILIGATAATPVALDIAVNEVLYRIAAGTLDGLALAAGSLLTGGATQLEAVAIAAGEVVVGATGPVIDGVALATGSILIGDSGATPVALDIAVNEVLYRIAAGTLAGLALTRLQLLKGGAAQLEALTIAAGDIVTANATDVAVVAIAAGEVVVGADGPVIDGVALATGNILKGATGATPVVQAIAALQLLYFDSILADITVLNVAAGDLVTATAADIAVVSIAAGEVVVGAAGPAIDGVALADNQLLVGATGTTPVALAVAASRVVGRTAAGVLDDIQIDNTHMAADSVDSAQYVDGSVDPEHMAVLTITHENTAGNVALTPAQMLGGVVVKDAVAGGPFNVTLGDTNTAAIIAVMGAAVGSYFRFIFQNNDDTVMTIVAVDGNMTLYGDVSIAASGSALITVVKTAAGTVDVYITAGTT